MDSTLLQVLAILFLASIIRSAFGFGEALVAVPLLALVIPINVAAPVAVLISITIAGIVVLQDWRHVHFRSAGWLVLSTLVGTPLGLILLSMAAERTIKLILAVIIIAFSAFSLLGRTKAKLQDDRLAWLFGFCAGVLGGAYGMNGPPLVIYGALRGWSPRQFRATLQGYFLPASLMVMGGYWITGLWTSEVTRYYLVSLPEVVVAILLGRAINRRMSGHAFLLYIYMGLMMVGALLLFQSVIQR